MKKALILAALLTATTIAAHAQTTNYFGSSGTINGNVWSTNVGGPYTSALNTSGGAVIVFNNNVSAITGALFTNRGFIANANVTNWTAGGTIVNFGNGISTINVASGALLDFGTQQFTSSATAGYSKTGDGVLALAGGGYGGGFTLNAGTVIVRGTSALGVSNTTANTLVLNGGILAANATRDLSGRYGGGIIINSNFQFGVSSSIVSLSSDTANFRFDSPVTLAGGVRTITIGSAMRVTNIGIISNGGLILTNVAGASGSLRLFGASTYASGTTLLNGSLIVLGTNSTVSGGVITSGPVGTGTISMSNGSELWSDNTNARTLQNNLVLSGNVRFDSQTRTNVNFIRFNSAGLTTASTIALTGDTTIDTANSTNRLFLDNSITGNFNLTKTNVGRLYLGASNSFSGTFTASGDTTYLDVNNALAGVSAVNLTTNAVIVISTGVDAIKDTAAVTLSGSSTLDARGSQERIGSLTGSTNTTLQLGEFTVGAGSSFTVGDSTSTIFAGTISGTTNSNNSAVLTKVGTGTLTFAGSSNNTYTGRTTISGGTLELNKSPGTNAIVGNVTISNSATLLISSSDQVANTAAITLSGGTISRGAGVSETFGNLDLTAASSLDFGSGPSGNLTFGVYEGAATPDFKLTVNNFFGGNTLVFGTDLSSFIDASYTGTAFTSTWFDINSTSGGFTSAWNNSTSTFTITAIPEPGTIVAAIGLAGLFAWPLRRHFLPRRGSSRQV